jgi:hypothetical protein
MNTPRDNFRISVFKRDNNRCVMCGEPAVDAHHIIERRLWPDGGYHIDNGASVCEKHHLDAEMTLITLEEIREKAGIKKVLVPETLYSGELLTKWGDVILSDGTRTPGPLFHDESVQKILARGGVLPLYRRWVKHPKSMHFPWSASVNPKDGDAIQRDLSLLTSGEIVVTEKLDGEQTTLYSDHIHARSVDSADSSGTRDWVKNLWAQIRSDIPLGWRVCGENLYAKHSIGYENLESFFYVHSMWDESNRCISYEDTVEWADLLNLHVAPLLYRENGMRSL